MKTALAFTVAGMLLATATVMTANAASKPNRISIHYVHPKNPAHQRLYTLLKEGRRLEKVQEFLSPFRLPETLKVSVAGCDGEADAFYEEAAITICYEYIDELAKNMPAETTPDGVAPIDTVIGPLFDTVLHEFAHALFDMLELPVLGPEEGAADLVAAYIYLQLGEAEARRLIAGTVHTYLSEAQRRSAPLTLSDFADEHGTPAQRAYNLLCIAYGADADLFGDIVNKRYLPEKRAEFCEEEYEQIQDAFHILIAPHIDRSLAKKVLDRSWLPEKTERK
jgi:hypothetical protein